MSHQTQQEPTPTVFAKLFEPLEPLVEQVAQECPPEWNSLTLSFPNFLKDLVYGFVIEIGSLRLLVGGLQTSPQAKELGLTPASLTTFHESFLRFPSSLFRDTFCRLLESCSWIKVPEFEALGQLCCVDGSLFPALTTMDWAVYQKKVQAFKFHCCFELNRMVPLQFVIGPGNSNEKKVLLQIAQPGVTYISDRGYVSFPLFRQIHEKKALFIIRSKKNLLTTVVENLQVEIPPSFLKLYSQVADQKVRFTKDPSGIEYRMITFWAAGTYFVLVTNRFDLTTFEVIILYSFRWQVELLFKFLKQTLRGLHLFNHSPNGVEIHFYSILTTAALQLHFKQQCTLQVSGPIQTTHDSLTAAAEAAAAASPKPIIIAGDLVQAMGKGLQEIWKVGIHWLKTLRAWISRPFTPEVASLLAAVPEGKPNTRKQGLTTVCCKPQESQPVKVEACQDERKAA